MEEIKLFFAIILVSLIALIVVCGLIHILLHWSGLWDKICVKIKIPKPKKFLTKVSPIYEVKDDNWNEGYFIHKYELTYRQKGGVQFLLILIPYPIEILFYEYEWCGSMFLCKNDEIETIDRDIKDIYEEKAEIQRLEYEKDKSIKDSKKNKINQLNKVFNENYE